MATERKTQKKGVLKREWNGKLHKKGQQAVQDQSVHDDGEELGNNEGLN